MLELNFFFLSSSCPNCPRGGSHLEPNLARMEDDEEVPFSIPVVFAKVIYAVCGLVLSSN